VCDKPPTGRRGVITTNCDFML